MLVEVREEEEVEEGRGVTKKVISKECTKK